MRRLTPLETRQQAMKERMERGGPPHLTPADDEALRRLLPHETALDPALRWAAEFSRDLPPRQVRCTNRALQANVNALDEHFRRKKFKVRLSHTRRRARLRNAEGSFTVEEWVELVRRYEYSCAYCGLKTKHLTVDHIMPLARGGSNYIDNIAPACKRCNSKKGTRDPEFLGIQRGVR